MIPVPRPSKPIEIERMSVREWLRGTVTALDDGRTPTDGLRASGNVILDQDGTVRPRPSLVRYGTQPPGTVLGEIYEFVRVESNVAINYLCALINVSGTVQVYYCKDGGSWTAATGKTYNTTAKAHFCQVDNKVLVMNGSDTLSYLDLTGLTVTPFTALPAATITSAVATTIGGAILTYYYYVSANSTVGETAASAAASVGVTKDRSQWIPASEYVTVSWPAVTGAKSYNLYLGETSTATAYLISSGINGTSFRDDGTFAVNTNLSAPLGDTTAGPIVTRAAYINSRVFLTGDINNPRYVRYGGIGTSVLDFSPFNGGGWVELGRGGKEFPVRVMSFRDGRGNPQITVLCRSTNGNGKRYIMSPDTITVGSTVIDFFDVSEDNGQAGTDSPDGVILYNDALWYPSRDGAKTTGTKPQLQNLLSTDTVSETIQRDFRNLNNLNMDKCVGLAFQNILYWAVANGSTTNNEIWTLDLQHNGAWMKPWSIAADWMVLYNSNDGQTHHLVISNNVIYELSYGAATSDDGTAFRTNITSGLIKFSDDGLEWAKVIDVTFVLLRPQGTLNYTIAGMTEDSTTLQAVGSGSFTTSSSVAGWGETGWGGSPDIAAPRKPQIYSWSSWPTIPVSFGDVQKLITIEIDEELQWLTYEQDSSGTGVDFQLADVILRFVKVGVKDLT